MLGQIIHPQAAKIIIILLLLLLVFCVYGVCVCVHVQVDVSVYPSVWRSEEGVGYPFLLFFLSFETRSVLEQEARCFGYLAGQ